ncbi:MAG TPA: hypothetical protein VGS80_22160 [Ktedonobacterales bacterium]|nr:hypothetical protein [Ktedonobacterales bacterium]
MDIIVDPVSRRVWQTGTGLVAVAPLVIEALTDVQAAALSTAIRSIIGDGYVTLSADHATIANVAPTVAWAVSPEGLDLRHARALRALKATLTTTAVTIDSDLAAIQALATNLQAGTALTGAQVQQAIRFLLRALAVKR